MVTPEDPRFALVRRLLENARSEHYRLIEARLFAPTLDQLARDAAHTIFGDITSQFTYRPLRGLMDAVSLAPGPAASRGWLSGVGAAGGSVLSSLL